MRRAIRLLFLLLLQCVAGLLLGFAVAYILGFDRTRDLLLIGLGNGLGVWATGSLALFRNGESPALETLVTTVAGALLGVALIAFTLSFSYGALLVPLAGAVLGYFLGSR